MGSKEHLATFAGNGENRPKPAVRSAREIVTKFGITLVTKLTTQQNFDEPLVKLSLREQIWLFALGQ